jgi:hypothetical protein
VITHARTGLSSPSLATSGPVQPSFLLILPWNPLKKVQSPVPPVHRFIDKYIDKINLDATRLSTMRFSLVCSTAHPIVTSFQITFITVVADKYIDKINLDATRLSTTRFSLWCSTAHPIVTSFQITFITVWNKILKNPKIIPGR